MSEFSSFLYNTDAALHTNARPRRRTSRLPAGYMSVASAATQVGRAESCVYRDIELGRLAVHRWRGRLLIKSEDLARWSVPEPINTASPGNNSRAALKSGGVANV